MVQVAISCFERKKIIMSSFKHVCLHGSSKTPEISWNSYTFNEIQYARKKETLVTKKKKLSDFIRPMVLIKFLLKQYIIWLVTLSYWRFWLYDVARQLPFSHRLVWFYQSHSKKITYCIWYPFTDLIDCICGW